MLSVKPDRPVDALIIAVSREIDRVARDLELSYFLAGAMARDILLTHVFGIAIGRATRDVDFGVAVRSWDQFDVVKRRLIETGRFGPADKSMQRIYYKSQSSNAGYPVDTRDAVHVAIQNFLWDDNTGLPAPAYSEDDIKIKTDHVFRHVYRVYPTIPSPFFSA